MLDVGGIDASASEVRQLSVVMEDAVQAMTPVEQQAALDTVPPETLSQLNQITLDSLNFNSLYSISIDGHDFIKSK